MEMVSSTISDLPRFVRRRDILPDVNGGFGRLSLSRYSYSDLASPDQFWIVSLGCREEVCPRNIYPGYYVFDNGDSFSRLPTTSTMWFGYLSLEYQWWCSCRCCLINLMAACVHKVLVLRLKIKKGEPLVVFTGLWFSGVGVVLRLPSEKYKIVSWMKKKLEDFLDLIVSFSFAFVIDVIMYSLLV